MVTDDIDFFAALADDPQKDSMIGKKTDRRKGKRHKDCISNDNLDNQTILVNSVGIIENISNLDYEFNMKATMTAKELKFIEAHFSGEYTIIQSMKLAGYDGIEDNSLYKLARNIVHKYERQAPDKREIMRALGYGEVKAIQMMIDAATRFRSETVRLNARATLGKWLGLQQEEIDAGEGITIVVRGGGAPAATLDLPAVSGKALPALPGPGFKVIK